MQTVDTANSGILNLRRHELRVRSANRGRRAKDEKRDTV